MHTAADASNYQTVDPEYNNESDSDENQREDIEISGKTLQTKFIMHSQDTIVSQKGP